MKWTKYRDRNGERIAFGDIVFVEEDPDENRGGTLAYEAVIEEVDGGVYAVYYDICEREEMPLSYFPKRGRRLLNEEERRKYWRTALLGGEPPEYLYKRELYKYEGELK